MASIRSLDILDIARSFGNAPFHATPSTVADWLHDNYSSSGGGGFNYDPAISAIFDAFRGGHTVKSAVDYCLNNGNPKGRKQNASAIGAIMPYALEHPSVCHRVGLTAVAIGRYSGQTVYAKIKAPMVRVEGRAAFLVMPGLRMSFRPLDVAIDLACSIALETCAEGDLRSRISSISMRVRVRATKAACSKPFMARIGTAIPETKSIASSKCM